MEASRGIVPWLLIVARIQRRTVAERRNETDRAWQSWQYSILVGVRWGPPRAIYGSGRAFSENMKE